MEEAKQKKKKYITADASSALDNVMFVSSLLISAVADAASPVWNQPCGVHIYNHANSVYIQHIYGQELRPLLFICSLFCERVAFIFDILLFGVDQYIRRNKANSSYFDGPTYWNAADGLEKHRSASTLTGFDNKHNFVTFDPFLFALQNHPVIDSLLCVR